MIVNLRRHDRLQRHARSPLSLDGQKRFQGSHLSNDEQAAAVTKLVADGKVDPCLSKTYDFDEIPLCHQLMLDNKHPYGQHGGDGERSPARSGPERMTG